MGVKKTKADIAVTNQDADEQDLKKPEEEIENCNPTLDINESKQSPREEELKGKFTGSIFVISKIFIKQLRSVLLILLKMKMIQMRKII